MAAGKVALYLVLGLCILASLTPQTEAAKKKKGRAPKRRMGEIVNGLEKNVTKLWSEVKMLSQPVHVHIHGDGHVMDPHDHHDDHDHHDHHDDHDHHDHHDDHDHHGHHDDHDDHHDDHDHHDHHDDHDHHDHHDDHGHHDDHHHDHDHDRKGKNDSDDEAAATPAEKKKMMHMKKKMMHGKKGDHPHPHPHPHKHGKKDGEMGKDHKHAHGDKMEGHKSHKHDDHDHDHDHDHDEEDDDDHLHHDPSGTHVHIHLHTFLEKMDRQHRYHKHDHDDHHHRNHSDHDHPESEHIYARCDVIGNSALADNSLVKNIGGTIMFRQKSSHDPLEIKVDLRGFPLDHSNSRSGQSHEHLRGMHGHTFGDLSNGCVNLGGHFNPTGSSHGGPDDDHRHPGDFGNLQLDEKGNAVMSFTENHGTLFYRNSLLGRGIVIHEEADDLGKENNPGSKASGNAGRRIACCAIIACPKPDKIWDE